MEQSCRSLLFYRLINKYEKVTLNQCEMGHSHDTYYFEVAISSTEHVCDNDCDGLYLSEEYVVSESFKKKKMTSSVTFA